MDWDLKTTYLAMGDASSCERTSRSLTHRSGYKYRTSIHHHWLWLWDATCVVVASSIRQLWGYVRWIETPAGKALRNSSPVESTNCVKFVFITNQTSNNDWPKHSWLYLYTSKIKHKLTCNCVADRAIRHRACALKDTADAIIAAELDTDFDKMCEEIMKARERRGIVEGRNIYM